MGAPVALTRADVTDIWCARGRLGVVRLDLRTAYDEKSDPDEADVEVDGEGENLDWDESATGWMDAKKAAVRHAVACLVNDAGSLPGIGRRVERVVRQVGTVDIYFDDGSFVSATVDDPQPSTNEEQAVVDQVYGDLPRGPAMGHTGAGPEVDMVAAVRGAEMLAAADARKRGALDPRYWRLRTEGPFDLYRLRGVPMREAVLFSDVGTRTSRLRSARQAWTMARRHADPRPFQRVR